MHTFQLCFHTLLALLEGVIPSLGSDAGQCPPFAMFLPGHCSVGAIVELLSMVRFSSACRVGSGSGLSQVGSSLFSSIVLSIRSGSTSNLAWFGRLQLP